MLNWKYTEEHQRLMLETMGIVFRKHPSLLEFLFDTEKPELRQHPDDLLIEAGAFSTGEKILIQIGLDLWSDSGNVRLWDIVERLDDSNYRNFLMALLHIRRTDSEF